MGYIGIMFFFQAEFDKSNLFLNSETIEDDIYVKINL